MIMVSKETTPGNLTEKLTSREWAAFQQDLMESSASLKLSAG